MGRGSALAAVGLAGCLAAPPGSTGPLDGDGGAGGDGGPTGDSPCAQPSLLVDDFGDTEPLPGFVLSSGIGTAVATMSGSEVVLDFNTSGSAGFETYQAFNLEESSAFIQVTQVPDQVTSASLYFSARYSDQIAFEFFLRDGTLHAQYALPDDGALVVDSVVFEPGAHRWWRLREEDDTMFWEVSADAASWEVIAQTETVVPLRYVRFLLYGVIEDVGADGGEAHIDDFNGGESASGQWCSAGSLGQDFESAQTDTAWAIADPTGCVVRKTSGWLELALPAGLTGSCAYLSRPRFDLTGSSVAVEMVEAIGADEDALSGLRLSLDQQSWIEMRVEGAMVKAMTSVDGDPVVVWQTGYQPALHAMVRILEEQGRVHFETSDGRVWTRRKSIAAPFDLTRLETRLWVDVTSTPIKNAALVKFDNYNLNLPP